MQNVHCLFWNSYLMAYWPNRCVEMIFKFCQIKYIDSFIFCDVLALLRRGSSTAHRISPAHVAGLGQLQRWGEEWYYFRAKANPRFYKCSPQVMEIWAYFHPKWTDSGPKCHSFSEGRHSFPRSGYDLVSWCLAVCGGSPLDGSGARCRANAVLIKFAGGAGELGPNQNVRRSLVRTIM